MLEDQPTALGKGLDINNANIETAPGVILDDHQKTMVGSVLDISSFTHSIVHHF